MNSKSKKMLMMLGMFLALGIGLLLPRQAMAHCDTLAGPVVAAARIALAQGDITPVLKWVSAEEEKEIREAFAKTLAVRKQSPEAKELADTYFFETLVRIHRAGEGAPYTGLKPGTAIEPIVVLADQALAAGSVDKLVGELTKAMAEGIRERFTRTHENQKHVDDSVAAGREFVESYVVFTHYVEGLHERIKNNAAHHGESGADGVGGHVQ